MTALTVVHDALPHGGRDAALACNDPQTSRPEHSFSKVSALMLHFLMAVRYEQCGGVVSARHNKGGFTSLGRSCLPGQPPTRKRPWPPMNGSSLQRGLFPKRSFVLKEAHFLGEAVLLNSTDYSSRCRKTFSCIFFPSLTLGTLRSSKTECYCLNARLPARKPKEAFSPELPRCNCCSQCADFLAYLLVLTWTYKAEDW